MQNQSTIICGSRQTKLDLSSAIDKFDIIVRHNKALPGVGYGKRDADIQVLNKHVYANYKSRLSAEQLHEYYKPMGITAEHIYKYYDYIYRLEPHKVIHYERNNQELMERIAVKYDLNITEQIINMNKIKRNNDTLHMRCGMAHIAQCIYLEIKPWIVGYSIDDSTTSHCYNDKRPTGAHDPCLESMLIRELHDRGLVDASLCDLNENGDWVGLLHTTGTARRIYNDHIRGH